MSLKLLYKQLIAITHEVFEEFDFNPSLQVRSVFLDTSKALDKVWYKSLLYKAKSTAIVGKRFELIENCLSVRFRGVTLNEQAS